MSQAPLTQAQDVPLNDSMSVSFEVPGYASIHYHPDPGMRDRLKLKAFEDGLTELARQLSTRTDITHVAATSWLVATNPDFFTKRRKFRLAGDTENQEDVKLLIAEYRRRLAAGMVVPDEHASTEPKVALLEMKDLLARLVS